MGEAAGAASRAVSAMSAPSAASPGVFGIPWPSPRPRSDNCHIIGGIRYFIYFVVVQVHARIPVPWSPYNLARSMGEKRRQAKLFLLVRLVARDHATIQRSQRGDVEQSISHLEMRESPRRRAPGGNCSPFYLSAHHTCMQHVRPRFVTVSLCDSTSHNALQVLGHSLALIPSGQSL